MITKLQQQAKQDLATFLKVAAGAGSAITAARLDYLRGIAKPLLGTLAAVGASAGAAYYFTKKDKERHQDDLTNSFKSLLQKSPQFEKNPEKFVERFGELTVISPTIAKNPTLASKLLDKKVKSGFSVDDIHKLTSIEHNTSSMKGFHPAAAARASASHALTTIINAFGRDIVEGKRELDKDYYKTLAQTKHTASYHDKITELADKEREAFVKRWGDDDDEGQKKQSSAQRVSDECLGQMLAERYVLIKQAGVFGKGVQNMATGLQYFAPAIALGGGIELMRQAFESHRNSRLEEQADQNFSKLMRGSDILKGPENKELAQEAFATLKAVAPSLAARPLVAKTFIEYTVNQGALPPQTIQQLAEAEDKVRGVGGRGGFFEELKSSIGGKSSRDFMKPSVIKEIEGSRYLGRTKKRV